MQIMFYILLSLIEIAMLYLLILALSPRAQRSRPCLGKKDAQVPNFAIVGALARAVKSATTQSAVRIRIKRMPERRLNAGNNSIGFQQQPDTVWL